MIAKHSKGISKFFKVYLSTYTILLGMAFITCVCYVFFTGSSRENIFSAEIVSQMLTYLLAPLIVYIVSCILAYIFYQFYPEKEKLFVKARPITFLKRVKKYDLAFVQDANNKKILTRNKIIRLITYISTAAVIFVCLFVSVWFIKDADNFLTDDPIHRNVNLFVELIPFVAIALVWGIASVFVVDITAKQDIAILKKEELFKLDKKLKVLVDPKVEKITINIVRIAIGVTAITFIILGIFNGGMRDVFIKAINICTECIGLG